MKNIIEKAIKRRMKMNKFEQKLNKILQTESTPKSTIDRINKKVRPAKYIIPGKKEGKNLPKQITPGKTADHDPTRAGKVLHQERERNE